MTMRKNDSKMLLNWIFLTIIFEASGLYLKSSNMLDVTAINNSTVIKPVPICDNATYCEDTPHYPTDIIIEALRKDPRLIDYANIDEMDVFTRLEDKLEEEPLCLSAEQIIFPKSAKTKRSEWKYIVNHENFTQSVRIETCMEESKPCKVIEGFAEGYYTKCKQKYIYRQLLALAPDGSLYRESFRFPASCCCHITFQADKFLRSFNSND